MDCLRSFYINIDNSITWGGPDAQTWGTLGNQNFSLFKIADSQFDIQGFKNINLYSIEMTGSVNSLLGAATGKCVVNDYGYYMVLTGLIPEVSGVVQTAPNFWNISPYNEEISISKYLNKIEFESPIQSLKNIRFNAFFAGGNGAETLNTVSLRTNLTFVFKFKYEGE